MKFLIVQLPPLSRHLIPLRPKYSSQNPVLKHPSLAIIKNYELINLPPVFGLGNFWNAVHRTALDNC
jgi:hypothetical protein